MNASAQTAFETPPAGAALPWILRLGVAGCFIGHGTFGIIGKAAWVPYFGVAGISEPYAWRIMPWVGTLDIVIGILALVRPCRALLFWAAAWAISTALLRPLSGESAWEFFERAGNYGVPLALLALVGWRGPLFPRLVFLEASALSKTQQLRLAWTLRLTTATLLAGHGGCGLFLRKASLARHYASLWPTAPASLVPAIGAGELLLAVAVLIGPRPALLLAVCAWKIGTESLFLVAGAPVWEVVERFGSYTAPLAFALLLLQRRPRPV